MTILYDSKDHFSVIFSITGTVWSSVLPLCIINTCITFLVFTLMDFDIVDVTFSGDAHSIMAIMVAFLTVSRVSTAYSRFWEARTCVGKSLQLLNSVALEASAFTKMDVSEGAHEWRVLLGNRLISLLQSAVYVIQRPELTIEMLHNTNKKPSGPESLQIKVVSSVEDRNFILSQQGTSMNNFSNSFREKNLYPDPMNIVAYVHGAISLQSDLLKEPLIIHKEMKLHNYLLSYIQYYHEMAKFCATPYPFPIAQMTRIFLFVWMFTLPFALAHEAEEPISIMLIIFFITYGFFGLEFVSIELDDPFGHDANDIEMDKLTSTIMSNITKYLKPNELEEVAKK